MGIAIQIMVIESQPVIFSDEMGDESELRSLVVVIFISEEHTALTYLE